MFLVHAQFTFSIVETVSHFGHCKIQRDYWLVMGWIRVNKIKGSSGKPLVLALPSDRPLIISECTSPLITWPTRDCTWPWLTLSLYTHILHIRSSCWLGEALSVSLFRFQRAWPSSSLYTRSQHRLKWLFLSWGLLFDHSPETNRKEWWCQRVKLNNVCLWSGQYTLEWVVGVGSPVINIAVKKQLQVRCQPTWVLIQIP